MANPNQDQQHLQEQEQEQEKQQQQQMKDHARKPDDQNRLKDQENLRK